MESTYEQQIKKIITELQDGYDIKSLENELLQSEIQDTLKPLQLLSEQNNFLIAMMEEVIEHEKKKPSARITASKSRLLTLLGINTQLSNVCCYNQSLKLFNRELVTRIQLLRVENSDLKRQLKNVTDAANF